MFDKPGVVPSYRTLKLLPGLNQKVRGQVQGLPRSPAADGAPPAERPDLTRSVASAERGKPVALPGRGRPVARPADGVAGRGRGSKRRPAGNGPDRGCNLTPRETGLTSLWCWRTGTGSQPAQEAKQNGRRGRNGRCWCGFRHRHHLGSRLCRRNAQVGPKANGATAFRKRCRRAVEPSRVVSRRDVVRGLSCMRRKVPVQFLGGRGPVMASGYPTLRPPF